MRLVLLSGGVDSTTALFWSKKECPTHALILKYPSLHNAMEVQCAIKICKQENIPHTLLDISSVFANFKSALLQNNLDSRPSVIASLSNKAKQSADIIDNLDSNSKNSHFVSESSISDSMEVLESHSHTNIESAPSVIASLSNKTKLFTNNTNKLDCCDFDKSKSSTNNNLDSNNFENSKKSSTESKLESKKDFSTLKKIQNNNAIDSIPKDSYTLESIAKFVVPFRNGIFLSIAAGLAQSLGCTEVVLANHAGDHPIYPDCTQDFIDSMNASIINGSGGLVKLCSPFCNWDKKDIVRLGISLGIDYSKTYSCYKGGEKHCNICPTCIESNESFLANNLIVKR